MTINTFCEEIFLGRAPLEIRNDYESCLTTVENNGLAIEYVNKELLNTDICLVAIKQNKSAIKLIHSEFKDKIIMIFLLGGDN